MIKISIDELRSLIERMENENKHHAKKAIAYITIQAYPNGRKYLEFEQPCKYAECFSTFYRYDEK